MAIPKLLDMLAIDGAIVTRWGASARKIIDKRADYVLALKDNQGTLREDVEVFVEEQKASSTRRSAGIRRSTVIASKPARQR